MRERRFSLSRMDVRFFSDQAFMVEDVLLAMGDIVGCGKIVSASRMCKAVVVFPKEENLVNRHVENGIFVMDTLLLLTPLCVPVTKVTISNMPPFISNKEISKELSRFGKFTSSIKVVPLGCKNIALKRAVFSKTSFHVFKCTL